MFKKVFKWIPAAITAGLIMTGCGGGAGSSDGNTGLAARETGVGYYQDAAVFGVSYECGDLSGTTDKKGKFEFEKGKGCRFSVAGILLREVDPSQLDEGVVLFENDLKVAAFLQSLDADGNPGNGITITGEIVEALRLSNVTKIPEDADKRRIVVAAVKAKAPHVNVRAVEESTAAEHLAKSWRELKAEHGEKAVATTPMRGDDMNPAMEEYIQTASGAEKKRGDASSASVTAPVESSRPDTTGPAMNASNGEEIRKSAAEESANENASEDGASVTPVIRPPLDSGLPRLDDETFNRLDEDTRIAIAKKLYTTLYKGKSIADLRREVRSGHFITDLQARLRARDILQPDLGNVYVDEYVIPYDARAGDRLFEKRWRIYSHIATKLYYTKLGAEYFSEWMAYLLNQTIMFSPAYEVDSVVKFPELVASNYQRIERALDADKPIRTLVYEHMISKENWARFRSPEDNGREMLEIWLYDYEDAHVPLAARALRNWRWEVRREKNDEGIYGDIYRFYNDENNAKEKNDEPVELFGTKIVTGSDFYRMVANHPRLVPTVIRRLVNLFFPTFGSEEKDEVAFAIEASEPETFREIFEQILFSKKYLLASDRLKSPEEIYMGIAHILDLKPNGTTFRYLFTHCMIPGNQAPFTYKLGRLDEGVNDTDSVIRMHQYMRSAIFLNRRADGWDAGALRERYDAGTLEGYLDNMFQDVAGRKMTADERETLSAIIADAGIDIENLRAWDKFSITLMVFDYFSRLSEIYTYTKVDAGGAS